VTVVARLRASEPQRGHDLPAGQVCSIAVGQIASQTGHTTYQAYGALVSESPAVSPAPAALDPVRPDGGEGINASYAVQWVVFALLGLGFPVWVVRRRREAAAEREAEAAASPPAGPPPDDQDAVAVPVAVPAAARQRKRRHHVWDDEDE
jgi:cytochrome oxidase assembly protein ShyY1